MAREHQAARRSEDAGEASGPRHVRLGSANGTRSLAPTRDRPLRADLAGLLQLQRKAGNAAVAGLLCQSPQPSQPLEPGIRSRLESGLGADLADVRLSLDSAAAAREGAAAFTVGSRIVVDPAHYRPGTPSGDGLLAHEAAHVVQQREAASETSGPEASGPELEAEADRAAVAVATEQTPVGGVLTRLRSALSLRRCHREVHRAPVVAVEPPRVVGEGVKVTGVANPVAGPGTDFDALVPIQQAVAGLIAAVGDNANKRHPWEVILPARQDGVGARVAEHAPE